MLLPRQNLLWKVLYAASDHSLTAVVAPMGYGKTTLARGLIDVLPGKAYYYAVPAGPHDGHFVWHDMGVTLEAQKFSVASALRRLNLPETASQARQALEYLREPTDKDEQIYLILDDYHHVTDPLMDAFWERAAREEIPRLHIILLSRTNPGVNLEELRFKSRAVLFDHTHLAFSQEETDVFFRANGIEDPGAAALSQRFSEGWPVVIWLCLQSWQKNGGIAASGDIDSLLANAVFAAYSPDERDLLLRLSVFESFTEKDAGKIAREAGWLPVSLLELRQKNAFLSFDAQTQAYQFHSIFREFLRKRLAATAHIDKPPLYRLAGELCLARGDHACAFRLFHKAGRDEDFSRILDVFRRIMEERLPFYFAEERFRMADDMPWRVRLQNPLGWLAFVALYTQMWHDQRTASLLDEAEERFRQAPVISDAMKRRLQGEIEVIRGNLAFNDLEPTIRHYREAIRLLDGPSLFTGNKANWNFGSPSLTFVGLRESGTYGALPELGAEFLREYNVLSGGKIQGAETLLRAEYLLVHGDFAGAEPLFRDALYICGDNDSRLMTALIASFGLSRLLVAEGEAEKALSMLAVLRARAEERDVFEMFDAIDVAQGYINAILGRCDAIPLWLRNGEMLDPPHNMTPYIFGVCVAIHGKALLLRGDYQRLASAARNLPDAAPIESIFARMHGKILLAVATWHMQGQSEAMALLGEAIELSRPDGLALLLAEYGGALLPLLRRVRQSSSRGEKDEYLETVLRLAESIARFVASPEKAQKTVLTPREREILRHVAKGETNPVIAERLHISVNAVKAMLGKASAKLGAFNRVDAARRFGEMNGDNRG